MLRYIAKRLVFAIPTLFAVSIVAFIIIQLPPGDYLTTLMADWASQGGAVEAGTVAAMRERYGLDQPIYCPVLQVDRRHPDSAAISASPSSSASRSRSSSGTASASRCCSRF